MLRTNKADWFTQYLYSQGFWVGGTRVNVNSKGEPEARQTLRFFKGKQDSFLLVYVLIFEGSRQKEFDVRSSIIESAGLIPLNIDFILAIWPDERYKFDVISEGVFYSHLETDHVLKFFEKHEPSLIGKSQYLKPLNRSYTDYFHLWAREHTNGFQNDIDGFINEEQQLHLLELKRPKESVRTWRPYRADMNNYIQLSRFANETESNLTNIAYSLEEPGLIKVFVEVQAIHDGRLRYKQELLQISPQSNLMTEISKVTYSIEESRR